MKGVKRIYVDITKLDTELISQNWALKSNITEFDI